MSEPSLISIKYTAAGIAEKTVGGQIKVKSPTLTLNLRYRELFEDRSDIAALFGTLLPSEPGEVDPAWAQVRHLTDEGIFRINAIRAGATYFFTAHAAQGDEAFEETVVHESREALMRLMNENRWQYLDMAVMGFEQSPAYGNEVFINWIPEWLIAFTLPLNTDRLKYV